MVWFLYANGTGRRILHIDKNAFLVHFLKNKWSSCLAPSASSCKPPPNFLRTLKLTIEKAHSLTLSLRNEGNFWECCVLNRFHTVVVSLGCWRWEVEDKSKQPRNWSGRPGPWRSLPELQHQVQLSHAEDKSGRLKQGSGFSCFLSWSDLHSKPPFLFNWKVVGTLVRQRQGPL